MAGVGREGGAIPVMGAQGEVIPVMGAFGGPLREECLARLLRTYAVTMICGLCKRARHLSTMRVDPVRASYAHHQTC